MLKTIQEYGWIAYSYDGHDLERHLLHVAASLGTPTIGREKKAVTERIRPMNEQKARTSSLSRRFGFNALPLHTDTAHWIEPSRFVVLGCSNAGLRESRTLLADSRSLKFSDAEWNETAKATYRVLNGRHSFFAPIFGPEKQFCRFDEGCMDPVDNLSTEVMRKISYLFKNGPLEEISWQRGKVLIIDNWRMLHGRTAVSQKEDQRELIRVMSK